MTWSCWSEVACFAAGCSAAACTVRIAAAVLAITPTNLPPPSPS